jgi:hypothetical protein
MRSAPHILVVNGTKVRRPVFIVGAPHSGTDLLALALKRSTGFHLTASRPEVMRVVYAFARKPSMATDRERGAARVLRDALAESWRMSPDSCTACPAECRSLGSFPGPGPCVQATDVDRFADASPDLLYSADVLLDAFPDAQLIQVIRDGRDVVAEMLADERCLTWFKPGFTNLDEVFPNPFLGVEDHTDLARWPKAAVAVKCALRWRGSVRLSARLRAQIPAEQLFTVRYEDLVSGPSAVAPRMSAFLDAPISKIALSGLVPSRGRKAEQSSIGIWRDRLTDRQAQQVERIAARELTRLGYPISAAKPA